MKKVNDFRDLNRVSRMQDATLEKWHFLIRNLREGGQLSQLKNMVHRIKLEDIISVEFRRGSNDMFVTTISIKIRHKRTFLKGKI